MTTTIEASCVVGLDEREVLYWHLPLDRSAGFLPDSRALWDIYWENRHHMAGQAHSHPGYGWPAPSHEDITTYSACERALGRRYLWWIASMDRLVLVRWVESLGVIGHEGEGYEVERVYDEPPWVEELRRHSIKSDEKELGNG